MDRALAEQVCLLRQHAHVLEEQIELLNRPLPESARPPPPPEWVKANVTRDEPPQKRGTKEGHDAHLRPPTSHIDEEQEVSLPSSSKCGSHLGEPFARDERTVETIAPGYVRVTRYHIARYRLSHCHKVRRARLPPDMAAPRSHFTLSTRFLVGYWSMKGLTNSLLRDQPASDYGLKVSVGVFDKMLRRTAELFAPAYESIRLPLKEGRQVNVDGTGWRVDGVNHQLWDFSSPDVKTAFFKVDRSAVHTVPEKVLGKRGPKGQVLNCDGGVAFDSLHGKKQRCWIHILRKAVQGQERWECPSDASDWRGLRTMEKLARRILEVARWSPDSRKTAEARHLKAWVRRWLKVEREGEVALARTVVVGQDGSGCPQQRGGAGTATPHRGEAETVVGIEDQPWCGPHRRAGERDPNGEDAGDPVPGVGGQGSAGAGEPDPIQAWTTCP